MLFFYRELMTEISILVVVATLVLTTFFYLIWFGQSGHRIFLYLLAFSLVAYGLQLLLPEFLQWLKYWQTILVWLVLAILFCVVLYFLARARAWGPMAFFGAAVGASLLVYTQGWIHSGRISADQTMPQSTIDYIVRRNMNKYAKAKNVSLKHYWTGVIPVCNDAREWSEAMFTPPGRFIQGWNAKYLGMQFRTSAGWQTDMTGVTDKITAIRYCTNLSGRADKTMPVFLIR